MPWMIDHLSYYKEKPAAICKTGLLLSTKVIKYTAVNGCGARLQKELIQVEKDTPRLVLFLQES